jgi:hypothetical protein
VARAREEEQDVCSDSSATPKLILQLRVSGATEFFLAVVLWRSRCELLCEEEEEEVVEEEEEQEEEEEEASAMPCKWESYIHP